MDVSVFDFNLLGTAGLIIILVYFAGGLVDSVCGGGGLITLPGLLAIGMPAHVAVATNQFSAVFGAATALYKYARSGNMNYRIAFCSLPFTIIGALLGARFNLMISDHYLQIIMLVLIPALAIFTLVNKNIGEENRLHELSKKRIFIAAALVGIIVGGYHAFYGPASGMFYVIGYAVFLRIDFLKSNGIARLELIAASLIGGSTYMLNGYMCWKAVIPATIAYILGNYVGASLAISSGAKFVRPVFYCILAALFIKLICDALI